MVKSSRFRGLGVGIAMSLAASVWAATPETLFPVELPAREWVQFDAAGFTKPVCGVECIPRSFYGNQPLVYFYPELALSSLRGYKAYMREDGAVPYGDDYYQDMMLWSLPAAMEAQDLAAPCKPGGLVHRVLQAAK